MGNWTDFDQDADGDGTSELEQTREHNKANEIDDEYHGNTPSDSIDETIGTE